MPLPASHTKHLDLLAHPIPRQPDHLLLPLRQISSSSSEGATKNGNGSTGTTGTTLWLSGQVLACYLSSLPLPTTTASSSSKSNPNFGQNGNTPRPRVLELGSGIGYTSLCLASFGYEVLASDIEPVLSGVLSDNVENGLRVMRASMERGRVGEVVVKNLDWEDVSNRLGKRRRRRGGDNDSRAMDDDAMEKVEVGSNGENGNDDLDWLDDNPWDMIVMTDTFYAPHLIAPLWDTLEYVSTSQPASNTTTTSSPPSTRIPPIYIGIEVRDPPLIAQALEEGRQRGFELKKIGKKRVGKELERWGWKSEDWEGVEIWKAKWRGGG
ncbi:hypothetical protein CI109_106586 [Kwoniella shandongensis]|uniref:Uncharacterized protein n=1 Tax=Kwoniella shandongensis TaxID=1734106 RepID=A0A5M6C2Z0_9TREE|nr:uncharacterized protein CI109_002768 [Kwoniella shandongensis]KAA5529010.1 hypothetical protein CI109_002768 [Kwoniella shandongensis]